MMYMIQIECDDEKSAYLCLAAIVTLPAIGMMLEHRDNTLYVHENKARLLIVSKANAQTAAYLLNDLDFQPSLYSVRSY